MKKFLSKIFKLSDRKPENKEKTAKERELECKVEKGTQKAIKEYREVFERLAEYDRS